MARWLLKTEPDTYSFDDLVRDRTTTWDGVANALALKHVRAMREGDEAVVYHTGDEKAAVGLAVVASAPYADPAGGDDKLAVVDLTAGRRLPSPVPLSAIKADPAFAGWDLLRIGRLSVVPVPDPMWDRLMELSATGPATTAAGAPTTTAKATKPAKATKAAGAAKPARK